MLIPRVTPFNVFVVLLYAALAYVLWPVTLGQGIAIVLLSGVLQLMHFIRGVLWTWK